QLAAKFTALIYEERRRSEGGQKDEGPLMKSANKAVRRFRDIEFDAGVAHPVKEPDWGIAAAVDCWSKGGTVEDLERLTRGDAGDVVRNLRMAIQMMRQVAIQVGKKESLANRLEEAIVAINRDVVDAKRQFELG
ncbi:MAG TPA: hypothetical protein EYP98_21625, partial [Planctomycetes bacterium]|nr:hypothetical protein [Planctomycetota bacterium]